MPRTADTRSLRTDGTATLPIGRRHDHPPAPRRPSRPLALHGGAVAIDTETMGLDPHRDRLCVVQLSPGDGSADVVQIPSEQRDAPNLKRLLGRSGEC